MIPPSPMHRAIHRLIDTLRSDALLEVEATFSIDEATDAMLDALEQTKSDSTRAAVSAIADALVDAPGVEELYADDATLERLLHEVFGELEPQ